MVTVNEDGKLLYHSLVANNPLKSEEIAGPTHSLEKKLSR